jgi:hypothetical protein
MRLRVGLGGIVSHGFKTDLKLFQFLDRLPLLQNLAPGTKGWNDMPWVNPG